MSIESKTLLDIAMLAQVEGQKAKATKLRDAAKYIEDLELVNLAQERELLTLKEGACRFNCRTKSVMWKAGGRYVYENWHKMARPASVHLDQMYERWRKENGE